MEIGKRYSDMDLIKMAIDGHQPAYSELLHRYKDAVYFLILKIVRTPEDAEDLTYITFTKAFNNLATYDSAFKFSTWLFKIASNSAIDLLRKKSVKTLSISNEDETESGEVSIDYLGQFSDSDPEELIIKEQRKKIARNMVKHLDENMEKVIKLRFFDEYSYEEISKALDLPIGTVKVQIFRAKKLLQTILKSDSKDL
ncbi:MAG: sigma-70 family RNA polymerase sigma factor [Chitinophagales bacterium]|nr:sigma-70 family RNA polymerase sigma factor [Chitinophagales bacterium]